MTSNQLPIVHALVDAFLFLEHSAPDEVNPDSAVRCMENMADSLLKLDEAEQLSLRFQFAHIAANSANANYSDFIRHIPDAIGLAGESPEGN
jgi:hypothetical protein